MPLAFRQRHLYRFDFMKRMNSFEDTHEISFHQIKLGFSKLVLVKKGDQQDECTPIWNIKILEMPLAKNLL